MQCAVWLTTVAVVSGPSAMLAALPSLALGAAVAGLADLVRVGTLDRLLPTQAELRTLSQRDELTGLLDRRGFLEAAQAHLDRGRRVRVWFVDVDGLKAVKDERGHVVGDVLLGSVGAALSDTFAGGVVARLSGDEFAVVEDHVGADGAAQARRALDARLALAAGATGLPVSVSTGVATSVAGSTLPASSRPRRRHVRERGRVPHGPAPGAEHQVVLSRAPPPDRPPCGSRTSGACGEAWDADPARRPEPIVTLSRRTLLRATAYAGGAAALAGGSAAGAAGLLTRAGAPAGTVLQLAVAHPQNAVQRALLATMDDTHAVVDGGVELLLWPGDAARLSEAGVPFRVTVADLVARDAALEAATAELAATIPGGKTDYQPLDAVYAELDALAARRPDLARVVELPHRSLEGRTVRGIEIYRGDAGDGRPVAYFDGCHHAREWPSADYCRLFAHHLVETAGTPRTDAVLDGLRVRIVPVVNVDGYVHSFSHKGRTTDTSTLGIVAGGQGAYVRKNNRVAPADQAHAADVSAAPAGEVDPHYGVDPNRNYAYLWGGTTGGLVNVPAPAGETAPAYATTSPNPADQTYFGTDAFSEPDTRNTRDFFLTHPVVTYLSNHTQGRLVLRPWGHTTVPAPDEALLKELGKALADAMVDPVNRFGPYENNIGLGLYATNGTSNDWAYAATGTLGYVIEHSTAFHPPYASAHAPGQQFPQAIEMFTRACEEALRLRSHSVLRGAVTRGGEPVPARLTLSRTTRTPYSRNGGVRDLGSVTAGRDELEETVVLVLQTQGAFTWHVNPSSRPIAGGPEAYTLTVEALDGAGSTTRQVVVERGQVLDLDLVL